MLDKHVDEYMQKFSVAIIGKMPADGYSGGRYHAWVMAEALAHNGNQTYVITNNLPQFSKDFEIYPNHKKIQVILTKDFYSFELAEKKLDYVICLPGVTEGKRFYDACLNLAVSKSARFAFINFETPNWYHDVYAKMDRPEKDYLTLRTLCRYGCLIFSSANESQKYAAEYYDRYPDKTEYCVWSPPINSMVADSIKEEKTQQIMIFLRIKDKHKGGDDFLRLLGEYLRGMTCVCVVGIGEIDRHFLEEAEEIAKQYGIKLRFEKSLNDYRKFQEMKKSKLLLFPSHFEGYGYPPVEALYCGTKCVVYDLPVLKEISGEFLTYCKMDDYQMMAQKAAELLKEEDREPVCVDTADFNKQAERMQHILEDNFKNPKLRCHRNVLIWLQIYLKKRYYLIKKNKFPETLKYCIAHNVIISKELKKSDESWKKVKKQMKGKKIYIWGCGKLYTELYPKYKKRIKIHGILDKSAAKVGTRDDLSGLIIQSPEILRKANQESVAVLLSGQRCVDEMIEDLKMFGISNSLRGKIYRIFNKQKACKDSSRKSN